MRTSQSPDTVSQVDDSSQEGRKTKDAYAEYQAQKAEWQKDKTGR